MSTTRRASARASRSWTGDSAGPLSARPTRNPPRVARGVPGCALLVDLVSVEESNAARRADGAQDAAGVQAEHGRLGDVQLEGRVRRGEPVGVRAPHGRKSARQAATN